MKYLLASLSISFFSFLFKGADLPVHEVPESVKSVFSEKFSDAVDTEWEKGKGNTYIAEFEIDKVDYTATFNKAAELTRYKHELSVNDLPEAISGVLRTSYSGYTVEDADKLVIGEVIYYQVELEGVVSDKDVVFTAEGNMAEKVNFWD